MTVAAERVEAVRGGDFYEQRTYRNLDGSAVNLTGATVDYALFYISQLHGETGVAAQAEVNTPGSDGVVTATIRAADIEDLEHDQYHWFWYVTPASSTSVLFGWGVWERVPAS